MTTFLATAVLVGSGWLVSGVARSTDTGGAVAQAFKQRMSGQATRAKQTLQTALAKEPGNAAAQFELARTCLYLIELDRAQTAIDQAVRLRPADARYQYWVGVIAEYNAVWKYKNATTRGQVAGLMKKALGAFVQAVALRPDYHEARLALVNCYLKNPAHMGGSRSEAERQAAILEAADTVFGARARGLLLGHRQVQPRRQLWDKVVASHPQRADAHEGAARATMGTAKGLEHLNKALALDPSRAELLVDLARHYGMAKQYGPAQHAVQRYLDFQPAPPVPMRAYATFCAAKIQKMQGQHARANALLKQAKTLDPACWTFFRQPPHALFTAP